MLSYLSKTSGIGGSLKSKAEDFIVEEIGNDGTVLAIDERVERPDEDGKFVHFILQKKNWSTSSALLEIAKRLGAGQQRFNAAGTKDKTAISTQLASGFGVSKEALLGLKIKDIQINGAWMAKDKVRLGQLLGNRFTIRVSEEGNENKKKETSERVKCVFEELNGGFPNYFGEQRFGSTRRNTHAIGQKLLQGDCEGALKMFLCDAEGEKNTESMEARKELASTNDYARALKYFPKHLRLERTMLAYLEKKPDDAVGALKKLPRNILLLFIHAFQSHIFNELLSERIRESENGYALELERGEYFCGESLGFPDIEKMEAEGWITGKLIGYGTPLNEREKVFLEKIKIDKDAFRMKSIPEIASKGTHRTLLAPLKDFDFNAGESVFRFSLASGCYATVAMREFLNKKD